MEKEADVRLGYISADVWREMDRAFSLARAEESGLKPKDFLERLIKAGIKALSTKEKK